MLFPPSTNTSYSGSRFAAWFLVLSGLLEFVPGCIHYFLPDGGAAVIAGLDLTRNGSLIVSTFGWMGSVQIPFGVALIVVGLRYRPLVPLFLLLNLIERLLMSVSAWIMHPSVTGHHPPEHYGSPVSVVLLAIFLYVALRSSAAARPAH